MLMTEGVLVQCDPSIKAILVKIDAEHKNEFIIEDIDDETLLVRDQKHDHLRSLLKDVRLCSLYCVRRTLMLTL